MQRVPNGSHLDCQDSSKAFLRWANSCSIPRFPSHWRGLQLRVSQSESQDANDWTSDSGDVRQTFLTRTHKLSFLAQSDSFLWWGGDSTGVSSYICLPVRLWCISGSAGHFGKFYTEIQVQDIFLKTLNNKVLQKDYMWKLIQPFRRFWTKRTFTRKCVSKVFI